MVAFCLLSLLLAGAFAQDQHIVGGYEVKIPGSYPWQCAIQDQGTLPTNWDLRCGCVYIGNVSVLTTASCIEGASTSRTRVVLGGHDIETLKFGQPELISMAAYQLHEDWEDVSTRGYPNDLALITLASAPSQDNAFIQGIAVPPADRDESDWVDAECVATGWGRTSSGGNANSLQYAPTNVITQEECDDVWRPFPIRDDHVCILSADKSSSACDGDKGSALQCRADEDSEWELVGLASWFRGECDPSYPSVYTKVSSFSEWINERLP